MDNNSPTRIVAMTKEQFLDFFRSECENAFINHVVEQDIFVSSMVRILLRTLNSDGRYLPSYESFNREEYLNQLYRELNHKDVEDFKGRLPAEKFKSSEFLNYKGMEYMCGAFQNMMPIVGVLADVLIQPETSQGINAWSLQNIAPNPMGYSFSEIAQEAADNTYKKKDKKKRIANFFDKEDLLSYVVSLPQEYGIGKSVVTSVVNVRESLHYFTQMHKQATKESVAESNRIVKDLKHKFIRKKKNDRTRYQIDKQTLYSMLLFACEYALTYSISI